jgi:hypothetical protein
MARKSGQLGPVTAKRRPVPDRSEQSPATRSSGLEGYINKHRFGLEVRMPGRRCDGLDDAFDRAIDEILGGAYCRSSGVRQRLRPIAAR